MGELADDILAPDPKDAAEAEALAKDQQAAHGAPPTGGEEGNEIVLIKTKEGKTLPIGKHTGLHYNGKGQDGQTFQDVYGPRKGRQRMDTPAAERGASGIIKTG